MDFDKIKQSLSARLKKVKKTRWMRFGVVSVLFFAFIVWLDNYWFLLL